jgi:hypothetical protein
MKWPEEFKGHVIRMDQAGGVWFLTVYDNHTPRGDPYKAQSIDYDECVHDVLQQMKAKKHDPRQH